MPSKSPAKSLVEVSAHKKNEDSYEDSLNSSEDSSVDDSSTESTTKHYQHITFSRGLSKYGPWSYLILGMLLCGGALLVCVLWGKKSRSILWTLVSATNFNKEWSAIQIIQLTHFACKVQLFERSDDYRIKLCMIDIKKMKMKKS